MRRIGHMGADLIAPGNTAASFDAALEVGVDMIEFDVLPDRSGELFLAHDPDDLARRRGDVMTLAEGLAHFAADAYAGVELNVDLKWHGYERRVVDALREAGLAERSLVSTMHRRSLAVVRGHAPEIKIGLSVPRLRRNPLERVHTAIPAYAGLLVLRRVLPRLVERAMRRGEFDALMAHFAFVTPALARAVDAAGGELYVWTVDEAPRIAELERLGVTGVITNDPRLFQPPTTQLASE